MRRFALIDAAGHGASRRMQVTRVAGGELVDAYDSSGTLGINGDYSPDADFFYKAFSVSIGATQIPPRRPS